MTAENVTAPATLRPGVRTYKPRRSRITEVQSAALTVDDGLLLARPDRPLPDGPLDLTALFGTGTPVVLEIGFGTGDPAAQVIADNPSTGYLAVDIHTPGVGDLLHRLRELGATNARVLEADALVVLERHVSPHSLTAVRALFPDPWPKARHHKRRLVQPAVLDLIRSRLVPGGTWHLATDWPEYAEAMVECFAADPQWFGGPVPRPSWRVPTRYERRALREGRTSTDLQFRTH